LEALTNTAMRRAFFRAVTIEDDGLASPPAIEGPLRANRAERAPRLGNALDQQPGETAVVCQ
jgi:hypothetical protein